MSGFSPFLLLIIIIQNDERRVLLSLSSETRTDKCHLGHVDGPSARGYSEVCFWPQFLLLYQRLDTLSASGFSRHLTFLPFLYCSITSPTAALLTFGYKSRLTMQRADSQNIQRIYALPSGSSHSPTAIHTINCLPVTSGDMLTNPEHHMVLKLVLSVKLNISRLHLLYYTTIKEYLCNPVVGRRFPFTLFATISSIFSPFQRTKGIISGRHEQSISIDYYTRRKRLRIAQLTLSPASGRSQNGLNQRDHLSRVCQDPINHDSNGGPNCDGYQRSLSLFPSAA